MTGFGFAAYFEIEVPTRRPHLTREICIRTVRRAVRIHVQADGRIRHWAIVEEFEGRALRVTTLPDGKTIPNAFLDRGFKL